MQRSVSGGDVNKDSSTVPLVFKVIRYSRPSLYFSNFQFPIDSAFVSGFQSTALCEKEATIYQPLDSTLYNSSLVGISQVTCLPSNFGAIYLGETFTCFISLSNVDPVKRFFNVSCRMELLTSSNRFVLVDSSSTPTSCLNQGQSLEFVVNHEIKELGVYTLICAATYFTEEEKKFFRKSYKFEVLNPISVKTRVNNSSPDGSVYLEVHVKNDITVPIHLEKLKIEPTDMFMVEDLNKISFSHSPNSSLSLGNKNPSVLSTAVFNPYHPWQQFNSQDTRQYIFKFIPKVNPAVMSKKDLGTLGKIDIAWRHSFGEIGMLQTNQLSRKIPTLSEFSLILLELKVVDSESVFLEEEFTAKIRIFNNTEKSYQRLFLWPVKGKSYSIVICGNLPIRVDGLKAKSFADLEISCIPLSPGLVSLQGFKLLEEFQTRIAGSIDSTFDVFVRKRKV